MTSNKSLIYITLLIGLVVQIVPMPVDVDAYRPDWLLMILCYWAMALPKRVSVGVAAFCGFALDILYGTSLGVHSLALAIPVFVVNANHQRFRNQSMLQQSLVIFVLCIVYHLAIYWLQFLIIDLEFRWSLFYPAISAILLWPWLFWLLRKTRRQFKVS